MPKFSAREPRRRIGRRRAYFNLKTTIFTQAAMWKRMKYAAIQHLDLRDTTCAEFLVVISKYASRCFHEVQVMGFFLTKLHSNVRCLNNSNPIDACRRFSPIGGHAGDNQRKHISEFPYPISVTMLADSKSTKDDIPASPTFAFKHIFL